MSGRQRGPRPKAKQKADPAPDEESSELQSSAWSEDPDDKLFIEYGIKNMADSAQKYLMHPHLIRKDVTDQMREARKEEAQLELFIQEIQKQAKNQIESLTKAHKAKIRSGFYTTDAERATAEAALQAERYNISACTQEHVTLRRNRIHRFQQKEIHSMMVQFLEAAFAINISTRQEGIENTESVTERLQRHKDTTTSLMERFSIVEQRLTELELHLVTPQHAATSSNRKTTTSEQTKTSKLDTSASKRPHTPRRGRHQQTPAVDRPRSSSQAFRERSASADAALRKGDIREAFVLAQQAAVAAVVEQEGRHSNLHVYPLQQNCDPSAISSTPLCSYNMPPAMWLSEDTPAVHESECWDDSICTDSESNYPRR